jgi:hypothetical protein
MDQGQSCPLCGQVDERPSMVMVRLPYPRISTHDTVLICRPCLSAIAGRAVEVEAEAAASVAPGSGNHERKHESKGKPGRRAHGEAATPDTSDPSAA